MSNWTIGFRSLKRRRLRTVLTVSGIVVGVALMAVLLALLQGMNTQLTEMLGGIGGADITVYNATTPTREREFMIQPYDTINQSYADIIKNNISEVYAVSPTLAVNGVVNGTQCTITGIEPDTYDAVTGGLNIMSGTSLPEGEENAVVLGKVLSDSLGASIGDTVSIGTATTETQSFIVVGIFETGMSFLDRSCYIHLDVAQNLTEKHGLISTILVKCTNPDVVDYVANTIQILIEGVRVVTQKTLVQQVSQITNTLGVFVGAIGIVALIAGSFGVMNTMAMSVFERTREIGVLKAIGARNSTILKMFLAEASLIGILSGVIGCIIGVIAAFAFPIFSRVATRGSTDIPLLITPVVTPTILGIALALGLIVSILAGLYPAWRAARMKTVEALRHA